MPDRRSLSGSEALRSSGLLIAGGTVASRATGFVRTAVIALVIGLPVGDAYNTANTIPNILYDLLLGGVLSAVVIPVLVDAAAREADRGEAFAQRLLTAVVVVLGGATLLAVVFAPHVIAPYDGRLDPQQRRLAADFARIFLPQLLFYGAGAVIGAILNTRDRFVAPMWAPVLNNMIVIATGLVFEAIVSNPSPRLRGTGFVVLSVGTTLGIVVQTLVLLPALRASGIRLRPRFDWRQLGLRRDGRFAAWVLSFVLVNQLGYVVVTRLANGAGAHRGAHEIGYSAYSYAYVLFSLPYAVVAVTVVTAVFPAMSRSGREGDLAAVRAALDRGLRLAGVLLVPGAAALFAFGPLITTVVFGHGHITVTQARAFGAVLAAFAVGLVPFAAFQMQFRAWLALRDARTPALVNLWATAVNVVADLVAVAVLPPRDQVVGLAAGFSLSYVVALVASSSALRRALGAPPRRGLVLRTHVRALLVTLVAVIPAYAVDRGLVAALGVDPAAALLVLVVSAGVGLAVFVIAARRLRLTELTTVASGLRLPGR